MRSEPVKEPCSRSRIPQVVVIGDHVPRKAIGLGGNFGLIRHELPPQRMSHCSVEVYSSRAPRDACYSSSQPPEGEAPRLSSVLYRMLDGTGETPVPPKRGAWKVAMKLGAVFPQAEIGNDPGRRSPFCPDRRITWIRRPGRLRPCARRRSGSCLGRLGGGVRTEARVPRDIRAVWLSRGVYGEAGAGEPSARFAAAASGACGQASGRDFGAFRWRLRLGLGVGWNQVEIEGLGESFTNRGRRFEEQVAVMRALWSTPSVKFDGEFHHIDGAGINPLPAGGKIRCGWVDGPRWSQAGRACWATGSCLI